MRANDRNRGGMIEKAHSNRAVDRRCRARIRPESTTPASDANRRPSSAQPRAAELGRESPAYSPSPDFSRKWSGYGVSVVATRFRERFADRLGAITSVFATRQSHGASDG